jgi:uncharacterized protein YerC
MAMPKVTPSRRKLRSCHIEYLLKSDTLRFWAHLSLEQRAKMLHRQFPEVRIGKDTLASLYKAHGVKYKAIRKVKRTIDFNNDYYKELLQVLQ